MTSYLANWTQHEPKSDPGSEPAVFKNSSSTLKVEHVCAVELGTKQSIEHTLRTNLNPEVQLVSKK